MMMRLAFGREAGSTSLCGLGEKKSDKGPATKISGIRKDPNMEENPRLNVNKRMVEAG